MSKDIFTPRGIAPEVVEARGYARYASAAEVLAADPRMNGTRELGDWSRHYGARGPGWVMPKHALPGSPFDAPLPQLRPDEPVPDPRKAYEHDHDEVYVSPYALAAHLKAHHRGRRVNGLHRHVPESKYLIPPGPHGKRWDTHPSCTADRFLAAERVFLHLEGTLKLDALVSAGEVGADVPSVTLWDRGGAVSWADWPGGKPAPAGGFFAEFEAEEAARAEQEDELADFLRERVLAPVVVVCDSDWRWNANVATEAFTLRDAVRKLGLLCVVAAPPATRGRKVGSDDFLAEGHAVNDLHVVEPVESPELGTFARHYARAQGQARRAVGARVKMDVDLLRWYATHAVAEGHVTRKVASVSRRLGVSRDTVRRATLRLADAGALRIVGYYAHADMGDKRGKGQRPPAATLLVDEALRPQVEALRLGDWLRRPA